MVRVGTAGEISLCFFFFFFLIAVGVGSHSLPSRGSSSDCAGLIAHGLLSEPWESTGYSTSNKMNSCSKWKSWFQVAEKMPTFTHYDAICLSISFVCGCALQSLAATYPAGLHSGTIPIQNFGLV